MGGRHTVKSMSDVAGEAVTATEEERHASWAELFFDLVVVAGVGTLAHVIHENVTWRSVLLYGVLFLTFWISWTTFMLYGNASGERTRTVRLFAAMFGLAVMAASVPGVAEDALHEGLEGSHSMMANSFALAYFVLRALGAGSWRRGQVVVDWPLAQQTSGAIPFLVSLWVDEPWKFALWGLGVVIDLLLLVMASGDDMLENAQQHVARLKRRDPERMAAFEGISPVALQSGHLGERLGLFVIIVLGEGVIQSVTAASDAPWTVGLLTTGLASFLLLVGMWALSVLHGYAGVPHLAGADVPRRLALALHCGTTASIAAVAATLGGVVAEGGEPMHDGPRWLLCGAIAIWFTLGLIASLAAHGAPSGRWRLLGVWVVTGIAAPLLIAFFGHQLHGVSVIWYLALVALVHIRLERRRPERAAASS